MGIIWAVTEIWGATRGGGGEGSVDARAKIPAKLLDVVEINTIRGDAFAYRVIRVV